MPVDDQLASAPIDTEQYAMIGLLHVRLAYKAAPAWWEKRLLHEALEVLERLEDEYRILNHSPEPPKAA